MRSAVVGLFCPLLVKQEQVETAGVLSARARRPASYPGSSAVVVPLALIDESEAWRRLSFLQQTVRKRGNSMPGTSWFRRNARSLQLTTRRWVGASRLCCVEFVAY